ncbi:hypothetical protein AAG570_005430 [Ranatra chinensis]|uniref:phosphoinositide 5-phosphatase n=1 Tax=Ranatra chinensis TaxID=642074 RepID=A0ABD0XZ51_9HEMI
MANGQLTDTRKPSSVTDLRSPIPTGRKFCSRLHKRSISLSKNTLNDDKSSLTSSGDGSPESVRPPRRRFLLKQRSVDNIVAPSLTGLSPISTRSVPNSSETKKKSSSGKRLESADRNRAPSMDSLARHSLLAAQVLHLIPAHKARERNYLHGRIAANSLLGSIELEKVLPSREVRIYVATWNMNGQAPPQGLNPLLLPDGLEHVPDIVAIGTQESYPERFQWEVTMQETLGPSHVLFHSLAFGTLHLAVFLRRDLIWFCSVAEESSFSVRPGTAFRTKGALGIAFYLFGTSFLFITCHLTAHQDKVKERLNDIRRITKSLELPKVLPLSRHSRDVTDNFDYVFWCGDLNFRICRPRTEVLNWLSQQSFPLDEPHEFTSEDQLTSNLSSGSVLRGFEEAPITFPPTYKYDPGTQNFDSSQKRRTPSYTDRILYKSRRSGPSGQESVQCLEYSSAQTVCTSDHKPVWGLYRSPIRPGIDTVPLAAGLFNREVYLEAIKKRAAAMDQRPDSSTVCSLQ